MQITSGQYWEKVSNEIGKPLQNEGGKGLSPSLGLPQYEKHTDSSLTRATLTAGTLILNKDGKPIVTTPEAIGINTALHLANERVEKPKDIQTMLTEQKATAQALSDMANAAGVYARQKYQETGDERWKDGGSYKRKLDATVAALGTALGGGSLGQVATAGISPELNAKIHELTKDNKTTNLLAHAALSALEAKATGNSATAGAAAGLIGEGSAMLLSETVLKKPAELLTAEERSLLKAVGLVSGAAAGGVVGGNTASATFGAETGKRAVENNYLKTKDIISWVSAFDKAKTPEEKEALLEKLSVLDDNLLIEALETRISKKELMRRREDLYALQNNKNCNEQCRTIAKYSSEQLDKLLPNYDKWYAKKFEDNRFNVALGLFTLGTGGVVTNAVSKCVPKLIDKPVLIAGGFGGSSELAGQLIEKDGDITKVDGIKVGISTAVGVITKDMGWKGVVATNSGVEFVDAYRTGKKDPKKEALLSGIASGVGAKVGSGFEKQLDKKYNPNWKINYTFETKYVPIPIHVSPEKSYVPSNVGNTIDNVSSGVIKGYLGKEGDNEE